MTELMYNLALACAAGGLLLAIWDHFNGGGKL